MKNLIAGGIPVGPPGGYNGIGRIGDTGLWISNLALIISGAIGLLTFVAIIWFLFTMLTGAIAIISSGGDKAAFQQAKGKITLGAVGLVVAIAAIFVLDLILYLLGIPSLFNIIDTLQIIRPI
jgi:hypothetical protein